LTGRALRTGAALLAFRVFLEGFFDTNSHLVWISNGL